jgi:hypothetical protein
VDLSQYERLAIHHAPGPMPRLLTLLAVLVPLATAASAQPSDADLLDAARQFPPMPREAADLLTGGFSAPGQFTFGSGTPYNDLEYTAFDTDYMEGETNGFDTFLPVDPSEALPGEGAVKLVRGVNNLDLEAAYSGPRGDRVILGTAEIAVPFFLKGDDGEDDDYAVIQNVDYGALVMQLRGGPDDYRLPYFTASDGVQTEGHYLFYVGGGDVDLVAFVWPCDVLGSTVSGNPPRNDQVLCNAPRRLSLDDGVNVRFAEPFAESAAVPDALAQVGTPGREVVGGVTADGAGNVYLFGASDGSVGGTLADPENAVFIAQVLPDGSRGWTFELPVSNGTLLFDAAADDRHLYAVGRTLGALPGFQSAGRWDAVLLKLDLATGALVDSDQYGTAALDGYGNVVLDGAGGLYVSGAGSAGGQAQTDPDYLVARHDAATLDVVWRVLEAPAAQGPVFVSEAWGGLSVAPASGERPARLLAGGWYMSAGGAAGFLSLYEDVDTAQPSRVATATVNSPGTQADWVLDNAIGPDGSLYAVGYTTGALGGANRGDGDAYAVRFDADLGNPAFVQIGTAQSDMFRKLEVGPDGSLYAAGYTYGDADGANPDPERRTGDAFVQKLSADLTPLAAAQFGTAGEDRAFAALGPDGLVVGGMTEAALAGPSAGSFDAYAVRLALDDLAVVPPGAVAAEPEPEGAALAVFPNPAASRASVRLAVPAAGPARVAVYDVLGREVAAVWDGPLGAGDHALALDLDRLAPGAYLVRAETADGALVRPLTVVR